MMKKEVSFMKKKGAPKSMLKHEMKEAGMKKMRGGGMPMGSDGRPTFVGDGKGKMRAGGLTAGHKAADGIAKKGKTKGKEVKMNYGGKVKKMAYGGKTC